MIDSLNRELATHKMRADMAEGLVQARQAEIAALQARAASLPFPFLLPSSLSYSSKVRDLVAAGARGLSPFPFPLPPPLLPFILL